MAISSMDTLVAAMTASTAQQLAYTKISVASEGAGTFFDLFYTSGSPGGAAAPAAASAGGTSYSNGSSGSLVFTAAGGGQSTYLAGMSVSCTVAASHYLTDRLWACSGLSTVNGATTAVTGMTSITRYSGGVGAEIWYVCLSTPSAQTNSTMTVSYTNSSGVAGRTATITLSSGSPPPTAGQCYPAQLQAGDVGVQSVQSVTNSSLSFTGGTHGLLVARRLLSMPGSASTAGTVLDGLQTGLQIVDDAACLSMIQMCSTSVTGFTVSSINLIQG
jgi:hypothetical protein